MEILEEFPGGSREFTQLVKNPPAVWEAWVRSLGWEEPLEKGTGYPVLENSGLENSMDCIVHGVPKSGWQLFKIYPYLFTVMPPHLFPSVLALSLTLHSIFIDIPPFSFSSWSIVFVFLGGSVQVGGYTLFFT